jgi:hypothetical protein
MRHVTITDLPRGRQRKATVTHFVVMAEGGVQAIEILREERPEQFVWEPEVSCVPHESRVALTHG